MKFIKGLPSTTNDAYPLNFTHIIRHAATMFPEQEILSRRLDGSIFRYNYREAFRRISRLANALESLGVGPGDRVGILSWNTHRFFEAYFGVPGIGAMLLILNPRLHPDEIAYIANHGKAKMILVDETLVPIAEAIAPKIKAEKYVIMADGELPETKLPNVYDYEELLKEQSDKYDFPLIDETSACASCYTSGTTGLPKGVFASHRALTLMIMMVALYAGMKPDDVFMQLVPMFHAYGWGNFQAATLVGAKLIFPGRYTMEDLKPIVDLMINEGVTISNGTPTLWMAILNYLRTLKEKPKFNMRVICAGTEPPVAMIKGLREFGIEIYHWYGSTEMMFTHYNPIKPKQKKELSEEEILELKGKQGLIFFPLQFKHVDESGKELPWDGKSAGELLVTGPWVAANYYNDPRTFESFEGEVPLRWIRSGDAVTVDEHGYMKLVDRFKDLIKSGGEWISSVDMENFLMAHPKVAEACVVGIPHPKWEERPLAFVVPKPEYKGKITKEELYEHLKQRFAKWQLPDEILFVDEIPKTSVGKFSKRTLREKYKDYYMKKA